MFLLGINSGLRISDLLKLKIKDVQDVDFIEIKEQKTQKYKRFPVNFAIKPTLLLNLQSCPSGVNLPSGNIMTASPAFNF